MSVPCLEEAEGFGFVGISRQTQKYRSSLWPLCLCGEKIVFDKYETKTNLTKSMGLGSFFVRCRGDSVHHGDDGLSGPLQAPWYLKH